MATDLLAFGFAFAAAAGLTPLMRHLALTLGIVDHPGPRKIHLLPMPLLGGVAVYAATVIGLGLVFVGDDRWLAVGVLTGGTILLIVGLFDDHRLVHYRTKFAAMLVSAVVLLAFGLHGEVFQAHRGFFPDPLSGSGDWLVWADHLLTLAWVVGITSAFSILDHMDGLCAGTAAVASAFFVVFAALSGQVFVGTLAAVMLGASTGFIRWNLNPARIFLGDAGAMFLGFMLAVTGLTLRFPDSPNTSWMIPVLVLIVPIFDTALVTMSRLRRGLVPFASPGKDHLAHRLNNLGLSHRATTLTVGAIGVLGGAAALLVSGSILTTTAAYALFATVVLAGLAAAVWLEGVPFERQPHHQTARPPSS